MASTHDVFLEGPHAESRHLVERTLVDHGFTLSAAPDGSTRATRGDLVSTLALRAFAGRAQMLTLSVQWFVDDRARLVARVVHEPALSVLGGPVGVIRAQRAVGEIVRALEVVALRPREP
ncbi:hypothetical protein [Frigoribacterium sp. VKM Ac-2836]|uniref:hypothetical protein n=1 Tax=Frigoribacterium sp. VKM Ac-2836 TaxID=2739014 RepID=UPI001564B79F|nr:hypothetical protein [Frigoribacterium sp. VKM Ac-2836]NRD27386.1 hypothetical protein [Frigoribacterium sp. VKM Ac-2836]